MIDKINNVPRLELNNYMAPKLSDRLRIETGMHKEIERNQNSQNVNASGS